jgi:homoserine kinase
MLPRLLPLAGQEGILGAALSGAGPAVLVVIESESVAVRAAELIRESLRDMAPAELLFCSFQNEGTKRCEETKTR